MHGIHLMKVIGAHGEPQVALPVSIPINMRQCFVAANPFAQSKQLHSSNSSD